MLEVINQYFIHQTTSLTFIWPWKWWHSHLHCCNGNICYDTTASNDKNLFFSKILKDIASSERSPYFRVNSSVHYFYLNLLTVAYHPAKCQTNILKRFREQSVWDFGSIWSKIAQYVTNKCFWRQSLLSPFFTYFATAPCRF